MREVWSMIGEAWLGMLTWFALCVCVDVLGAPVAHTIFVCVHVDKPICITLPFSSKRNLHAHTSVYRSVFVFTHVLFVHIYIYIHVNIYIYIHMCLCICINIHLHILMRT